MVKQVIVVRKDLNMRKGKTAAQVAHAAMKVFFNRMEITNGEVFTSNGMYKQPAWKATIKPIDADMKEWMEGSFTKVVLGVNSEQEVYDLAKEAESANLPFAVIVDSGFTEFHGNKTTTCIAIGPASSEKIDLITGKLFLI